MSTEFDKYSKDYLIECLKRMMVLGQFNCWITQEDGHRWIEWDSDAYRHNFVELVGGEGVVSSKVYGGHLEALNRIDAILKARGDETLLEMYDEDDLPWGNERYHGKL